MTARRAARILAFQVLYGLHFTPATSQAELARLFAATPLPDSSDAPDAPSPSDEMGVPGELGAQAADERQPSPERDGFAWELVEGTWSHAKHLDEMIARFSRNWRVNRMGRIELTLLRLAMFELAFRPDIPPRVAINEALELTAKFGDEKSKSFINGILDAAAKAAEAGTLASQHLPG